MRDVLLALTALVLAASSVPGKDRGPAPAEDRALARFSRAAIDAEAAYRETVLGTLKVLGSRLVDRERAAVRCGDMKEGNRIRDFRTRTARLAAEVSRHDFLAGTLPEIDKHLVPPSAKKSIEKAAGALSEVKGVYQQALRAAGADVQELIASALQLAVDSADLDAANRVRAVADAIAGEIATRLEPLTYAEYRFRAIRHAKEVFLLAESRSWRVENGELIVTAREGEQPEATLRRNFRRISAVTVRGRILPPGADNFRMSVGPVNLILNWERATACHFRYHEKRKEVRGDLLVPGREHEITVRQLTKRSIEVCVEGRRVWITRGTLHGTITVYPSVSTIGVREIRVLGVPDDATAFDGPSHRRW